MYTNNRFSGRGGGGFNRRPQFGNNSKRRMKFFDPSNMVKDSFVPEAQKEVEFIPKNSFSDFQIEPRLKANVLDRKYGNPTPIQDEAIPAGLEGRDVIGIARTGTGKTAAFLIPLINKALKNNREKVLIVAPTRELAVQIEDEFRIFAKNLNIYSILCIGGSNMGKQIGGLRRGCQFVIGTPGRLVDLEKQRQLRLNEYNNVVLDEVDRILDMGFIEDLKYLLEGLPQRRQSFFFSATMPERVELVARTFLNNPLKISIKSNEPTTSVMQEIVKLDGQSKVDVLHNLLVKDGFDKVLVFGRTKHGIQKLFDELKYRGFKVDAIHGNKTQNQRQRALDNFKSGYVNVLLATDIVARGVDISNVTHVINYELPESYEDYIHRIGRTGRAGNLGIAITLIN